MGQIGELYFNITQRNASKVKNEVQNLARELDRITQGLSPFGLKLPPGFGSGIPRATSATRELSNQLAIAKNEYRQLGDSSKITKAQTDQLVRSLEKIKASAIQSSKAVGISSTELKRLSAIGAQAQAGLDRISNSYNKLSVASTISNSVRSGLLTIGFAASNSVAGMALLTGAFASANAGAKAFLATIAILAPILIFGATVAGAAKEITSLEEAQVGLAKVTDLSDEQLTSITSTLKGFSTELGLSTQNLLGISAASARLGVTGVANIEAFTKTIADLSIATDVIGDQGAERIAKFLAVTGTASNELGEVANEVGNIINELGNQLPTTAARVLDFTRFTGQLGALAGVSRTQILGLSAGLDSLGITAEGAGNPLAKLFADVQKATREGGSSVKAYVEIINLARTENFETAESFSELINNNPIKAFEELAKGLNVVKESGASVNVALDALGVKELRQAKLLRQVAGGADTLSESLRIAQKELGELDSLETEVEKATATLGSNVRELGQDLRVISQDLGAALLPAFQGTVAAVNAGTSAFLKLAPSVRNAILLFGPLTAAALILGGPAGIIAVVAGGIVGLAQAFDNLKLRGLNADLGTLAEELENIGTPLGTSKEGVDALAAATGRDGLEKAVAGISATMKGPAKVAFETYAQSAIDTATSTVAAINQIFQFLADKQAQALSLSIENAKKQRALSAATLNEANRVAQAESQGIARRGREKLDNRRLKLAREFVDVQEEINQLTQEPKNQLAIAKLESKAKGLRSEMSLIGERIEGLNENLAGGAVQEAEEQLDSFNQKIVVMTKQLEVTQKIAANAFSGDELKAAYNFANTSTDEFTSNVAAGTEGINQLKSELDGLIGTLGTPANSESDLADTKRDADELNKTLAGLADNTEEAGKKAKRIKGAYELLNEELEKLKTQLQDAVTLGRPQGELEALQAQIAIREEQLQIIDATIKSLEGLGKESKRSLSSIREDLKAAGDELDNAFGEDNIRVAAELVNSLEEEEKQILDIIEATKELAKINQTIEDFNDSSVRSAGLDQLFDVSRLESLKNQLSEVESLIGSLSEFESEEAQAQVRQYAAEWRNLKAEVESVEIANQLEDFSKAFSDISVSGNIFGGEALKVAEDQLTSLRAEIDKTRAQISSGDFTPQGVLELSEFLGKLVADFVQLETAIESLTLAEVLKEISDESRSGAILDDLFSVDDVDKLSNRASTLESGIKSIRGLIDDGSLADPGAVAEAEAEIASLTARYQALEGQIKSIEFPVGSLAKFNKDLSKAQNDLLVATDASSRSIAQGTVENLERQKEALLAALDINSISEALSSALSSIDTAEAEGFADILFGENQQAVLESRLGSVETAITETQAVIQTLGDSDAVSLALAQDDLEGYIERWRALKDQIEQVQFPADSIADIENQIAKATEDLNLATTDSTRQAAKDQLAILEDQKQETLDKIRTLAEELSDLAEEQAERIGILVTQSAEGLGGVTAQGTRDQLNSELANALSDLADTQRDISGAGGVGALDLDDDLVVRFQSLVSEIDLLRSSIEKVDSTELEQFKDSLDDTVRSIEALEDIDPSELGTLLSARAGLNSQLSGLKSQQSTFGAESEDFKRIAVLIEEVNKALEELPTGFEGAAGAAEPFEKSVTNSAKALQLFFKAQQLGISTVKSATETPEELLARLEASIGVIDKLNKDLEIAEANLKIFGNEEGLAAQEAKLLEEAIRALTGLGLTELNDDALPELEERLKRSTLQANLLEVSIKDAISASSAVGLLGFRSSEDVIRDTIEDLSELKGITPEVAEELEKLGRSTGSYQDSLAKSLPILEQSLSSLKEQAKTDANLSEVVAELELRIAGLNAEYNEIASGGLSRYNAAIDIAQAKSKLFGDDFDLVAAQISAAKSAIDANIAEQFRLTNAVDLSDAALVSLFATLSDLEAPARLVQALVDIEKELELVSSLSNDSVKALADLGIETTSTSDLGEAYKEELLTQIQTLALFGEATDENRDKLIELQKKYDDFSAEQIGSQLDDLKKNLSSVTDVMQSVASGLNAFLDIDFGNGNSIISGLQGIAGAAAAIPGPVGAVAGAISVGLGAVGSVIGDLSNGIKQVRAEIDELNSGLNFVDVDSLVKTRKKSRGGLFGLFGLKKTEIDDDASAIGLAIAKSVDSGFSSGFKAAINTALGGGDTLKTLSEAINGSIRDAVVQAIFQGMVVKGAVGAAITRFTEALASGNLEAARQIAVGIQKSLPGLSKEIDRFAKDLGFSVKTEVEEALDFKDTLAKSVEDAIEKALDLSGLGDAEISIGLIGAREALNDLARLRGDLSVEIDIDEASFDDLLQRQADLTEFLSILDNIGIALSDEDLEVINDRLDSIKTKVESITGVSTASLTSAFTGAAGSVDGFVKSFGVSFEEVMRNAIIGAFANSAALQSIIGDFGDFINAALADGNLSDAELAIIDQYREKLEAAGIEVDLILDRLGLVKQETKELGEIEEIAGIDITVDDRSINDLRASLRELKVIQDQLEGGSTVVINDVEVDGKAVDDAVAEITDTIKSAFGITADDFSSSFADALDSATSKSDFAENFRGSIKDATRNGLIQALLETEAYKAAFENISNLFFDALADGVIDPEEQAAIDAAIDAQIKQGEAFFDLLEKAGLTTEEAKEAAEAIVDSFDNVEDAFNFRDQAKLVKQIIADLEAAGIDTSEIEFGIDVDNLEEDIESAVEFIKSALGTTSDDFRNVFTNAINDSNAPDKFLENWAKLFEDSTRDALIKSFTNSAELQAGFDEISNLVTDALSDGIIDASEQAAIDAAILEQGELGAEFIEVLKTLGLIKDEIITINGIDFEIGVEEELTLATATVEELLRTLEEANISADLGLEGAAEAVKQINDELSNRLGTSVKDFESAFTDALSSVDAENSFTDNFEKSINEATKNGIIEALVSTQAFQVGLKKISALFTDAIADGIIDDTEQAAIDNAIDAQTELGEKYVEFLEDLGLIDRTPDLEATVNNSINQNELDQRTLQLQLDISEIDQEEFLRKSKEISERAAKDRFEANRKSIEDLKGQVADDVIQEELTKNAEEYAISLAEIQAQFNKDLQSLFLEEATFDELIRKAAQLKAELTFSDDKTLKAFLETIDDRIKSTLGVAVNDLEGDIKSAFGNSEGVFKNFTESFGAALQDRTTDALVNAIIEGELAQAALSGLSDVIQEAVSDGSVTSADVGAIQLAQTAVQDAIQPIFNSLNSVGLLGQQSRNTAAALEEAENNINNTSDALKSFTQSLSNAPTGFNITRFIQSAVQPENSAASRRRQVENPAVVIKQGDTSVIVQGDAIGINDINGLVTNAIKNQQDEIQLQTGVLT